jgi:hypothetical protein
VSPLTRAGLARYVAPAAFLAAATVAVLLVRAGLKDEASVPTTPRTSFVRRATTAARIVRKRPKRVYYRLEAGDTLHSVALKFDTTVPQLLRYNPGVEPTSLRVGQKLRVR